MLTDGLNQKHTFVVDITKHKPLTDTLNLISSVREYVRLKFNTARMTWFIRPDQQVYLNGDVITVDNDSGLIIPKGEKIKNLINQLSQDGSFGHIFHVLSYERSVLTDASDLNGTSFVVTTGYLNNIYKTSSETSEANFANNVGASTTNGFGFASGFKPITLNEAIELAKKVLRNGNHFSPSTAFRLAALRTEMIKIDSRVRKNPSDYSSVNLMRNVINDGMRKGWMKMDSTNYKQGAEHVWLVERSFPNEQVSNRIGINESFNSYLNKQNIEVSRTDSNGNVLNYASPDNIASSEQSVRESVEEQHVRIETVKVQSETQKEPKRCTLMEMKLRERGIGSPVVPRNYFFDAVEQIFGEITEPITASQLIVLAREKAETSAKTAGYTRSQNWEAISNCFLRMMLSAKVLIKPDETPISNGIGGYSKPVVKVLPDFRDLCEAFLLEHIIDKLGDVTLNDLFALGLTLYQKGADDPTPKEEIIERADFLLQLLLDAGRISVDDEERISALKK